MCTSLTRIPKNRFFAEGFKAIILVRLVQLVHSATYQRRKVVSQDKISLRLAPSVPLQESKRNTLLTKKAKRDTRERGWRQSTGK